MNPKNDFFHDFLGEENQEKDLILKVAEKPEKISCNQGIIQMDIPFQSYQFAGRDFQKIDNQREIVSFFIQSFAGGVIRFTKNLNNSSEMLCFSDNLKSEQLILKNEKIFNKSGELRASFEPIESNFDAWENCREGKIKNIEKQFFTLTLYPDGKTPVKFCYDDIFCQGAYNSVALGFADSRALWSLHANATETFAGTGERFSKIDLSAKTITLENMDALGVNNRRCYKNIPFYLSSSGYGLFIHTPNHVMLSFADISTRATQGIIESENLDLFFIGGETPERILYNYRRITGFPPQLPLWSYGIWMSRISYFSQTEIDTVCKKLRSENYPCDVIHIDTGWFDRDWVCEFKFNEERFPDVENWLKRLKDDGFRVTLWQTPDLSGDNCLLPNALANKYVATRNNTQRSGSDFSSNYIAGCIDFSNPQAITWYQNLLANLLRKGVSAIKTDFGEAIDMSADYFGMSAKNLHNQYALLYQKAAFEITKKITGEGIIWARSAWAGSQRYPLHWGGDAAGNFDGLIGSLRGGLHLGCSGFAYWSHDICGFYSFPYFMGNKPSPELYMRWVQFGVFSSHMRFHGTWRREPYEYPEISQTIRDWFKLRYALIPYIQSEANKSVSGGMPLLRAMFLAYPEDHQCKNLDDQYMFGDSILVAPVYNQTGIRDIYLPLGNWHNFWTGEKIQGGKWISNIHNDLSHIPVFCRANSTIELYPYPVQNTDEMLLDKVQKLTIDDNFKGISQALPALKLSLVGSAPPLI